MPQSAGAVASENDNGPNPVDTHVGKRLRMLRKLKNISQEKLAQALGLTFQQVQKYERADNRIGASRLWEIAQVLGVAPSYFYEGYGKQTRAPAYGLAEDSDNSADDVMQRSETLKLVSLYYQIKDEATRKQVLEMVKTLGKK
ncbi:MAG TPA: helix-turn-helix transcriptional regulator [Alphaproteobacteria bacterium]|nr:transcriptional regulator [Rhodospirillaceae bacterium]HRJ12001.1 helix-turn-helix transcriptional regulator [Alphaproteobacteria bacterium]